MDGWSDGQTDVQIVVRTAGRLGVGLSQCMLVHQPSSENQTHRKECSDEEPSAPSRSPRLIEKYNCLHIIYIYIYIYILCHVKSYIIVPNCLTTRSLSQTHTHTHKCAEAYAHTHTLKNSQSKHAHTCRDAHKYISN